MGKVKKRTGKIEDVNVAEIQEYTRKAVEGLEGVSQSELEVDSMINFNSIISTEEIQWRLVKTAVDKIDIDAPNWTFVAARLQLFDYYHKVNPGTGKYSTLKEYTDRALESNRLLIGLREMYDLDILDMFVVQERDFNFNYLGLKTLYDRYLLKDQSGNLIELPQHMFMGISMFLASVETTLNAKKKEWLIKKVTEKAAELGKVIDLAKFASDEELMARTYYTLKFYDMVSEFEVMLATPTLSNARTQRHQLSSCYVGATPDNIEGIFDSYKQMALLSKFGGGLGWDWSSVRAIGSSIDGNVQAAGGTIPFLKITNDVGIAVDQLGTRKGAIAPYLEPWHLDINDFLDLRKNSGEERRRAHDLFPALWIPDLFMKRVMENGQWTLFDPYEIPELHESYGDDFEETYILAEKSDIYKKEVVSAKELWKKILTSYFETGMPFLCFKDNANKVNPNNHTGIIRSSNLCTEIFQNTKPSEYKAKIIYEDGTIEYFDQNAPIETDSGAVKIAAKLTSIDSINGKKVYFTEKEGFDGEIAVCNLASINLSKINTREDFERVVPLAMRALDNVVTLNFFPVKETKDMSVRKRPVGLGVMGESQFLAENKIKWGSDKHYEAIDYLMECFSFNVIKASSDIAAEKGAYSEFNGSKWSQGIFPIDLANENARELTNRELVYDWDGLREKVKKDGVRNAYMMAIAPTSSISILTGTTQAIEPIFKRKWFEENLSGLIPVCAPNLSPETWEFYVSAYDLDQRKLIEAGAIRQKWIDQGQSLNIFMTLDKASGKYLHQVYTLAWSLGLKSTYYLRSQSPEVANDVADRTIECVGCQ